MIILSQDKRMIINFDNIIGILIRKNTQENVYQIQCKSEYEKSCRILAKYSTEERAKEVLDEICATYEATEMFKSMSGYEERKAIYNTLEEYKQQPFTYMMPSEYEG